MTRLNGADRQLRTPGGEYHWVAELSAALLGKQLELLKEAVPQLARTAVLVNPHTPGLRFRTHNLTETARVLGLHLHVMEVGSPAELDQAFAAMIHARARGVHRGARAHRA